MNQYRTDKHLPRLAQLAKAYPHRALAISEISNRLAGKICRGLSVPEAGRS
jgi:hypothetical protein